jgi:hypothetical protein
MSMAERIALCMANGLSGPQALVVACKVYLLVDPEVFCTLINSGFTRQRVRFFKN